MSREDVEFTNIMRNTAELKNGHYNIDLPFREEDPVLPNRCVAEQRLQGRKRKFEKHTKFKEEYTSFINMLAQGYAEVVPIEQLEQEERKVWYIPHHGVHHPTKGKLRVYDCGTSYKGTSLNCQLLQGPDLTKVSDSNDLEALTPNHILLLKGKPIFPPGLFEKSDLYIRKKWKQVQYIAELFWKRWTSEYLLMMQERQRWAAPRRNLSQGDIVIIADAGAPRGSWKMGRVLSVKSDSKGLVRSVSIQTKTSILERPVTKVCLLVEATE